MNRTLLILGASTYQIPVIETAKRLGYRVITTDNVPANPGHTLADASFSADTADLEAILALAKSEGIAGIIAPATDIAVMTAAYVAEQLHLSGPPLAAAFTLTHKHQFRKFLSEAGLPCPSFLAVTSDQPPRDDLFEGRKWILKPNRSSGSKGVFIIQTADEFRTRVGESRVFSLDHGAVLEEFIEGTQHTCDGVLHEGRIALALVTDRDTAPAPHTATTGHRVPSPLTETMHKKAVVVIEEIFRRLGVASGPFDCDFVAEGNRIALIEMSPRLGGNSLSKLFKATLNYDLVSYAVAQACGDPSPIPELGQPKPMILTILGADRAGRLSWDESEAEALRREVWVNDLIFDLPQGTPVKPFINGRHRVGEALITGTDRYEVDNRLTEFNRRLALTAL